MLVNIKLYIKFSYNISIHSQDIKQKLNFDIKSRAITLLKTNKIGPFFNPNLDLVNINEYDYVIFDQNPFLCSQDTE